jgi:hypothetical protein
MSAPSPGDDADATLRARNLRTLAVLAGLFLLPLAGSFFAYYATGWRPVGHVNHGTLITPPRPLPAVLLVGAEETRAAAFRGLWSLVYVGDGACDDDCRATLYFMRQTRLGLGNDMTRVARVFVVTSNCCEREALARTEPGLTLVDATPGSAAQLAAQFPADGRAHTLFVVDPLGNLMMSYDARSNPHGLLEDLKKLLRLSHIG